jgi:hypothetical protein
VHITQIEQMRAIVATGIREAINIALERAAALAEQADLDDRNSNGAAASGGAYGLADRIRALKYPPAEA